MQREDAIQDVVRQFADPMAFLRELVQNAIDAGSGEVEITTQWNDAQRCAVVSVADWGEGMTREIVEERLVRLFNSTKEADRTKIGKFGIGFVSVFAVAPRVVAVDTGREGEHWRVLLHPDRSYELLALDEPAEGTTVRVYVPMTIERFEAFRNEAFQKTRRWCRFAAVPITFDGEDIREPFDLDGLIVVRAEEEGTRCVAALRKGMALGEFFNGGLALQLSASPWAHVSYLLDSRLLEHTLTRDRVLQNKRYEEAMKRLQRLVNDQLVAATKHALASWPDDPDRTWDWEVLCGLVLSALTPTQQRAARFPVIGGPPANYEQVRGARARNRLMVTRGRSHIAARMPPDFLLLDIRPGSNAAQLLRALVGRQIPVLEDVWAYPPVVDASAIPGSSALAREIGTALQEIGAPAQFVGYAQFGYPFSSIEERGIVVTPDRESVQHCGDLIGLKLREPNADLLLNPEHPIVAQALELAEAEPEWAAFMVIKCAALAAGAVERQELDEDLDVALATASLARRQARRAA